MKRSFIILCVLVIAACTELIETAEYQPNNQMELVIIAETENRLRETKTERQVGGAVWWSPGDAVSLFFVKGENGGNKFIAQNTSVSDRAEFKGTIDSFAGSPENAGGEFWFWGVYPYSENNRCDGTSVYLNLPSVQYAKEGTFADNMFPTLAKAKGLELSFYNICGGAKFILQRDDITSITFKSNGGELLSGTASVSFPDGSYPTINSLTDGADSIVLQAPEGDVFKPGVEYYMAIPPVALNTGFTLIFRTNTGKEGTYLYNKSRAITRSVFGRLNNIDANVTDWKEEEYHDIDIPGQDTSESGLYFGLSTFDRNYAYYPIRLLSEERVNGYKSIIDELQLTDLNGTLLYYSCDEGITAMKAASLPSDLINASLITFTDGLDQGSRNKHLELYKTAKEYLNAVHYRLNNETIIGLPIKSYAIGLKGPDAQSNPADFNQNLELLASTPATSSEKYVYTVDNINQLNDVFAAIANELSKKIQVQKVTAHFSLPDDKERIRITLDIAPKPVPTSSDADASGLYIEGIFNGDTWSLEDVVYKGFIATSGSTVKISHYDGYEVFFTFDGLQTASGNLIDGARVIKWAYTSSGTWQRTSEETPDQVPTVYTELRSALVLMNLDLSRSLEGQLPTLKTAAKNFVSLLYSSSVDPSIIKSIKLSHQNVSVAVGHSIALAAEVSPSTASSSGLAWSSSLPSVATVDAHGNITGVSEGNTIITVSAENGKVAASCKVNVEYRHVESIVLDEPTLSLYRGQKTQLKASVLPVDASNNSIVWTSSNESVVSVSDGTVSALSVGEAVIGATSAENPAICAFCRVTVQEPELSTVPKDLTLAVSHPEGGRFFVGREEFQNVNLDDYIVEGLYVVGLSGFIISLTDATSDSVGLIAANTFFNLPTRDQGMAISARWSDINNALSAYGGSPLSTSSYYWTNTKDTSSGSTWYYCVKGSGGTLVSNHQDNLARVREVIPVTHESPWYPINPDTGIYLAVRNGSNRLLVSSVNDVPDGYTHEGLVIESRGLKLAIALKDASTDAMTYTVASSLYSSRMPSIDQARLISARFTEINRALTKFGGDTLSSTSWYWTNSKDSSSGSNWYYCIHGSGGVMTSTFMSNTCRVRLILDTY